MKSILFISIFISSTFVFGAEKVVDSTCNAKLAIPYFEAKNVDKSNTPSKDHLDRFVSGLKSKGYKLQVLTTGLDEPLEKNFTNDTTLIFTGLFNPTKKIKTYENGEKRHLLDGNPDFLLELFQRSANSTTAIESAHIDLHITTKHAESEEKATSLINASIDYLVSLIPDCTIEK